jgi:hypothetical protein
MDRSFISSGKSLKAQGGSVMTSTKTAWLALSLLASMSIVAAVTANTWRAPATVDATPDQKVAQAEPVDDAPPKLAKEPEKEPEVSTREVVDPNPQPNLPGAEQPADSAPTVADSAPTALDAIMNITSRDRHDASEATKVTAPLPQQVKKIRDSKAEMRGKRSKTAANTRACRQTTAFTSWLRKLNLVPAPRCTT